MTGVGAGVNDGIGRGVAVAIGVVFGASDGRGVGVAVANGVDFGVAAGVAVGRTVGLADAEGRVVGLADTDGRAVGLADIDGRGVGVVETAGMALARGVGAAIVAGDGEPAVTAGAGATFGFSKRFGGASGGGVASAFILARARSASAWFAFPDQ
jgi:hypothetical protein